MSIFGCKPECQIPEWVHPSLPELAEQKVWNRVWNTFMRIRDCMLAFWSWAFKLGIPELEMQVKVLLFVIFPVFLSMLLCASPQLLLSQYDSANGRSKELQLWVPLVLWKPYSLPCCESPRAFIPEDSSAALAGLRFKQMLSLSLQLSKELSSSAFPLYSFFPHCIRTIVV